MSRRLPRREARATARPAQTSWCIPPFRPQAFGGARFQEKSPYPTRSGAGKEKAATATTVACGRSREKLLGPRPARRKCHPRHEADAGSRNSYCVYNVILSDKIQQGFAGAWGSAKPCCLFFFPREHERLVQVHRHQICRHEAPDNGLAQDDSIVLELRDEHQHKDHLAH